MTPEQQRDRESVWAQVAIQRPEFTHKHDPTDNWHAVREIVLGGSLAWIGANERFRPKIGSRVMDIGANVGLFSASCALRGAKVTAYEADPETVKILSQMISDTQLPINLKRVAVWTQDGRLPFYGFGSVTEGRLQRNGTVRLDGQGLSTGWTQDPIFVDCVSLDEAIGDEDWDCVKFDVEGAEFQILSNASNATLRRMKFCFIEVHPWADDNLYNQMISRLEDVFVLEGGKEPNGRWEYLYLTPR